MTGNGIREQEEVSTNDSYDLKRLKNIYMHAYERPVYSFVWFCDLDDTHVFVIVIF